MKVIYKVNALKDFPYFKVCERVGCKNGFEILKEDFCEVWSERNALFIYNEEWWEKYKELSEQERQVHILLAEHQCSLVPF